MIINRLIEKLKVIVAKLQNNNTLDYINGPEILPPPLTKDEEEKVYYLISNGDPKGRELLIVHNLRLVVYIAKKFENTPGNRGLRFLKSSGK